MAFEKGSRTFGNGIVALEMELTSGTWYTLWAPNWQVGGEQWQAFLGDKDHLFVFKSPAEVLAFIESTPKHDLSDHPKWQNFLKDKATNVVPKSDGKVSFVELPAKLADRPGYESTLAVTRSFDLLQSFGSVLNISSINSWFKSYSILQNTRRGADHYASQNGMEEWSGVGRTVLDKWATMTDDIEPFLKHPDLDEADVEDAQKRIDAAREARQAKLATMQEKKETASEDADPYDSTIWASTGIDPIRITMNNQYVYTLRCYVDSKPVFLGRHGEINTFPNPRSLVRWLIDAPKHDLDELATWGDILTAANAGELEVEVHPTNEYSFNGLREDISKDLNAVDTDQLSRAYELLADAADWAEDDAVNKVLLAYPRLQNYLAFQMGTPSEITPSAPFDEEVKGWRVLEEGLTKRFTKF
ncbi:hypothetical protein [Corynebacterium suicordis]|uniref:Uncharacterized protein n=1 Tax=Corynebacterium suicordis DSM 45110 TaxID=1121369 RepID=A0ABR9ZIS8_9CORY|nr:hypothetical protein [Corynebacterium suicordis]MBF4552986.1 hypothetical protein [Corynebacterium suicordis DSM 45110]MDR6278052.1 hypothetical protein [Corynebacterium suicordis]